LYAHSYRIYFTVQRGSESDGIR